MHLAVPRPTNATAAALLWTYGTLPALSHSTKLVEFRVVGGPMERLIWAAAGYRKPGDKFHAATDRAWWSRAFAQPAALWRELADMARAYDNEHPTHVEPVFASPIASATPDALKGYLTLAWENLQSARAKGIEPTPGKKPKPPIGVPPIPRVPTPPGMPPPDVIPAPPLPIPPGRGGGTGLLLLLVLGAIAYGTRGRR